MAATLDDGAALDIVTHEAPGGKVSAALADVATLEEVHGQPVAMRLISDRGV